MGDGKTADSRGILQAQSRTRMDRSHTGACICCQKRQDGDSRKTSSSSGVKLRDLEQVP